MAVTTLRLELPNIAEVAVYPATHYVQTTTNIVIYGSASLHRDNDNIDGENEDSREDQDHQDNTMTTRMDQDDMTRMGIETETRTI